MWYNVCKKSSNLKDDAAYSFGVFSLALAHVFFQSRRNHMKKIYIAFLQTQFKTGKTIRLLTHNRYNHVCISLYPSTKEMYSYARYNYHEPFMAGFGIEYTDRYYEAPEMSGIKMCEYTVDDDHYERIKEAISYYMQNIEKTRYNFFDVLMYPFQKHINIMLTHTCISFVLELLERNDVHTIGQLEKSIPESDVIFEGRLDEFENFSPSRSVVDFYEKRSRRAVFGGSVLVLGGLCASVFREIMVTVVENL